MELPTQIIKNLGLQVSAQPAETQSSGQMYEEGLYNKSIRSNRSDNNLYSRRQNQDSNIDTTSYDDRDDDYNDTSVANEYDDTAPPKRDVFNHSSMGYSDNIVNGELLSYDSQNQYGENDFNNRRVSVSDGTPNGDWWKMDNLLGNIGGKNFERRSSKPNVSPQSMFAYSINDVPVPPGVPEVKKKDTYNDGAFPEELREEEPHVVEEGGFYEVGSGEAESDEEPTAPVSHKESSDYQSFDDLPDKKQSRFAPDDEVVTAQPNRFMDKIKAIIPSRSEKPKSSIIERPPMPRTLAEARGNPNYTTSDDWFDEANEVKELDTEPENKANAFYKPVNKSKTHGFEVGIRKSDFEPYETKNLERGSSFEDMFGFKVGNNENKPVKTSDTLKQGNEDLFGFGGMGNGLTSDAIFENSMGNNTDGANNPFGAIGGQSGLTFADTFGFSLGGGVQHTRQIIRRAPAPSNTSSLNNQIPRAPSFNRENVKTKVVVKKVVQQPQQTIRSGSMENVMGRGFGSPAQPQQSQRPVKKGFFDSNSDYTSQFNKSSDLGFSVGGFSSNIFGNSEPKVIGISRPMAVSNQPVNKKSAKKIVKATNDLPSGVSNKPFGSKFTIGDGSTLELPKIKAVSHKPAKKQKPKSKSAKPSNKQTLKCNTVKVKTNVSSKKKIKSPKQSKPKQPKQPKQPNFDFGRLIWG